MWCTFQVLNVHQFYLLPNGYTQERDEKVDEVMAESNDLYEDVWSNS
jgi:hypothetical protein